MSVKRAALIGLLVMGLLAGRPVSVGLALHDTAPIRQAASPDVDVCTWNGCRDAAVSFTLDDGYMGCLAEMHDAGFQGTYYLILNDTIDPPTDAWVQATSLAGHEIGSHSANHVELSPSCFTYGIPPISTCTPENIWLCPYAPPYLPSDILSYRASELDPSIAAIELLTGKPVVSMAWPFGNTDGVRMTAAASYFVGVRGYYEYWSNGFTWVDDMNPPTPTEWMNLNAYRAYSLADLEATIAAGNWAVFVTHDNCAGVSVIGTLQDQLWAAPVGDVLKYIKVRDAATFSNYARNGTAIRFDGSHNLAPFARSLSDGTSLLPIYFDNPVTLMVRLADTDEVLGVQIDGTAVETYRVQTFENVRYVTFDTPLDGGRNVEVSLYPPTTTRLYGLRADSELGLPLALVLLPVLGVVVLASVRRGRKG